MKLKSIAFSSVIVALATVSMVANAQSNAASPKLILANGASCDLAWADFLDADAGSSLLMAGDSSSVFLQFASAMFNPKEYSLGRNASVIVKDSTGLSSEPKAIPTPESIRMILAGATSLVGSGGGRGNRGFSSNEVHHNVFSQALEDLVPFFASTDAAVVRLPPAVSIGRVDPIGHIFCALKTRTKSNQANERTKTKSNNANDRTYTIPEVNDEISAQNVRILLQGGDGKGEQIVAPVSMGAMKLTKADAGRALDATIGKDKKIQSWVKDCFDNRVAMFDPSLTNVLQFDVSNAEAERLAVRFQPGQSLRVKVKFPWLCDADCSMTEPIGKSFIEKVSPTTSRVSIFLMPEACRLLPTVNK